jgi:hypothetical protein
MTGATFQTRASGKMQGGGRSYPRGFPRLRVQLFVYRVDHAASKWAMDRIAKDYRKRDVGERMAE